MKRATAIICASAICAAGTPFYGCAPQESEGTKYRITATYDGGNTIEGRVETDFYNDTGNALDCLKFNLWGNAFREGAASSPVSEAAKADAYYGGESYGGMEITTVTGGEAQTGGDDMNILCITPAEPIYPEQRMTVSIEFVLKLANVNARTGVAEGAVNLGNFYRNGKQGLISPRPEQEREVERYGAEKGYPDAMYFYAYTLIDEKKDDEGLPLYRRSAELGEPRAFFMAGWSYELGRGVEKDVRRAADYYQRALAAPIQSKIGPANRLGAFYYNGDGVEQDYAKAFQLLKWAYDQDTSSNWGAYYLGACCAHGRGTQQDYVQARKFLEMVDWDNRNAFYLLGYLYARGLGGPEDIPKGVEYLQKAGDHAEAREELRRYKKTFFGKWVRR